MAGPLAADISNAVVRLVREHFGKGPTQAKTLLHDDAVVTILRGGFTHAEKTLYRAVGRTSSTRGAARCRACSSARCAPRWSG